MMEFRTVEHGIWLLEDSKHDIKLQLYDLPIDLVFFNEFLGI